MKDLLVELTGDVSSLWPRRVSWPTVLLIVNYAILHKIGISNWCHSSHKLGLSISLATLLYQIGTHAQFNYGVFVVNQIKRHIGVDSLKLPPSAIHSWFVVFYCLWNQSTLFTKPVGPSPTLLSINPKLLQNHHVPDIVVPTLAYRLDGLSQVLVDSPFGSRVLHLLSNEFCDISRLMQKLQECKLEVDALLQLMRVTLSTYGRVSSSQKRGWFFLSLKGGESSGSVSWLVVWFLFGSKIG